MQETHLTENIQLITDGGHKLYTIGDSPESWIGQRLYMGENWYTEEVVEAHWVDERIRRERTKELNRDS